MKPKAVTVLSSLFWSTMLAWMPEARAITAGVQEVPAWGWGEEEASGVVEREEVARESVLSSMRTMVGTARVLPARRRERHVGAISNRILNEWTGWVLD
jgi:hypothetical protein